MTHFVFPVTGNLTGQTAALPVDFFEHCSISADVEYGGNDLLQVYNVQQLKNRLTTNGLYIICNKVKGYFITL